MKKALVLGGSGFIGSHLTELLQKRKYKVGIYDLKEPLGFKFKGMFFQRDITNKLDLEVCIVGFKPDVMFDCSGVLGTAETFNHIERAIDVNIKGTLNVLEVARKHKIPMVYIGLTNKWLNPYTITKTAAERLCMMYAKEFKMKVAVLKGLNAYGSRQHIHKVRKIVPTFITAALDNKSLFVNGNGMQVVDIVHATDLSEMMLRMYEMGTCWGKSIDGGTGVPMTVNEVAEKIIKLVRSKSKILHMPMRRGEPEMSVTLAEPAGVRQFLDFYPEIGFDKGMKQAIKWYRKNYKTCE